MGQYNLIELGKFITKRRKELSKRQIDLADDLISVAYISNIENGRLLPSPKKLRHLCSKLDLNMDDLSTLIQANDYQSSVPPDNKISFQLMAIENDLATVGAEESYQELRTIQLSNDDPHQAIVLYLKGKYFSEKARWKQAAHHYHQAIRLAEHHSLQKENIISCCYCELSRVSYIQNDLHQAIRFVQDGIQAFVEEGLRSYVLYHLKICLVIYQQKLNRNEEALRILEELWASINKIHSSEVILNMYEMQASILNDLEMYNEATRYAIEGLEVARLDRSYDRQFELWTTLGTSYQSMGCLCEAKRCYQSAINLMKKIKREYLLITTKMQLGILYAKEKDFELAEKMLLEAVQLGKKTKDEIRHSEALVALGDCYSQQKSYTKALSSYEQALEIAEEYRLLKLERNTLLSILRLSDNLDCKKYQKVVDKFIQVSVLLAEGGETNMKLDGAANLTLYLEGDPPGT